MASFKIKCETCNAETKWEHENLKNRIEWENTAAGYNHAINLNSPWIYAKPDGLEEEIFAVKMVCNNCKSYVIII